jgi:hypothetical protein
VIVPKNKKKALKSLKIDKKNEGEGQKMCCNAKINEIQAFLLGFACRCTGNV